MATEAFPDTGTSPGATPKVRLQHLERVQPRHVLTLLATFWLPVLPGWLAFTVLTMRHVV